MLLFISIIEAQRRVSLRVDLLNASRFCFELVERKIRGWGDTSGCPLDAAEKRSISTDFRHAVASFNFARTSLVRMVDKSIQKIISAGLDENSIPVLLFSGLGEKILFYSAF
jgi:hypothetical protein